MPAQIYQFGPFQLDLRERQLVCDNRVIPLRGKIFDTLCVLVQHAGRLVYKDELMKAIWPETVVEENNLEHNVCVLRRIFRQDNAGHEVIQTVPRHGYRFVARVQTLDKAPASTAPAENCMQSWAFVTEGHSAHGLKSTE